MSQDTSGITALYRNFVQELRLPEYSSAGPATHQPHWRPDARTRGQADDDPPQHQAMTPATSTAVTLGSDRLIDSGALRGLRVGIVSNPASIDARFRHVVDRVARDSGATLGALFGPQHGFRSDLQDNMIETPHAEERRYRVPVYSLYSETRQPTAEMMHGLDALLIDLQDIGARIYTFIYTMAYCLEACGRFGYGRLSVIGPTR